MSYKPQVHTALSSEETKAVLAAADSRLATFLATENKTRAYQRPALFAWIALLTALRGSEVSRICMEDIDTAHRKIRVWRHKKRGPGYKKGVMWSGAIRDTVDVGQDVMDRIETARKNWKLPVVRFGVAPLCPLFTSRRGGFLTVRQLENDWKGLLLEAGISRGGGRGMYGLHVTRHTAATHLAEVNPDPYAIKDILGHENIAMASYYVEHRPSVCRKMADGLADRLLGRDRDKAPEPTAEAPDPEPDGGNTQIAASPDALIQFLLLGMAMGAKVGKEAA